MASPREEQNDPVAPSLVPAAAGGAPPPEEEDEDAALRPAWLGPWALGFAALLHLLPVILWLLGHLEMRPPLQPPAIQVTLVRAPPAPPPAPAAPPQLAPRESGPDQQTEAKKINKNQPALPRSGAPQESQANAAPAEPRPPQPPALEDHVIRLPQPGGAADRDLAGDPYLNRLMQMIERNRVYPPRSDFDGPVGRLVIYSIVIEPSGGINLITLLSSSGQPRVDEAARLMITASAPFPPLPPDYPQFRTRILVEIPIYPRGG